MLAINEGGSDGGSYTNVAFDTLVQWRVAVLFIPRGVKVFTYNIALRRD